MTNLGQPPTLAMRVRQQKRNVDTRVRPHVEFLWEEHQLLARDVDRAITLLERMVDYVRELSEPLDER